MKLEQDEQRGMNPVKVAFQRLEFQVGQLGHVGDRFEADSGDWRGGRFSADEFRGDEDVDFQRAWADPESGMVWCVSEAPNADAIRRIHERAGHPADEVYPVPVEV